MEKTRPTLIRSAEQRDRRAPTRLKDPDCPECLATKVRVVLRTSSGLYYRCDSCGHLLAMQAIAAVAAK